MTPGGALFNLVLVTCSVVAWRHWRRQGVAVPVGLGLRRNGAAREVGVGLGIGTLAMAGVFVVLLLAGADHVVGLRTPEPSLLVWWLGVPLSAFGEELIFRGFVLAGLVVLLRRRILAVAAMAALFGLVHAGNPGASAAGIASNALGGVVYACAFLASERLWLGFGLHLAWNLVQGPILGFPVSGHDLGGLLVHGPAALAWLGGDRYGPEEGVAAIVFRLVAVALVGWWWWRRPSPPRAPSAPEAPPGMLSDLAG